MNFIGEQAIILIPVIYIIGLILKGTKKIPDWTIPIILLFCSISLSIAVMGVSVQALIKGILVVGVAVYANQLVKQTVFKGLLNKENIPPKEINPEGEITELME